ncbi:MAG: penicillin-binding protein 1C, partial [Bacteroidota bacterium]
MALKKRFLIKWGVSFALLASLLFIAWPLTEPDYPYSSVLNDKDGQLLAASIAKDGQWRFPQPDTIPHKVATCVRYFEDRHFYRHPGVNPLSIG